MRLRFVTTPKGNYHMTELLLGLCRCAKDAGFDAELESGRFPVHDSETVYVLIPHEFYACEPPEHWPTRNHRDRTVVLFVENPFTQWFDDACGLAPHFASVMAINRASVRALRDRGVGATHLQLGYTEHWDVWRGSSDERPIDVTYLGAADEQRDAHVAGYGRWLWHRRTEMLVPVIAPKPDAREDYLIDQAKFMHLGRSKLLLNLHRQYTCSFEWVRTLQAMSNGCVVVSEPSVDHGPLLPGEHFVSGAASSVAHLANSLLDDPSRLASLRDAAYDLIRNDLTMKATIEQLAACADELLSGRSPHRLPASEPAIPSSTARTNEARDGEMTRRLAAAVRNITTDMVELRRAVQRMAQQAESQEDSGEPELVVCTPAFKNARPKVSVAITLFNYEREVISALASVAASEFEEYEVLVLDDGSSDGSIDAVRHFAVDHPWMPLALLRHRVNRGLGPSRNALSRNARGELMFVLDADNEIYPTALSRLVDALESDPGATFAYPTLAVTLGERAVGLLSQHAWDPNGFRRGNYVDAMSLIRLDDLVALGGYTEDPRLTGWEDFHLWCRCVEAGLRGHHVAEVLARYRKAGHSMLAWTQIDATVAWGVMHARFPDLLDPAVA